MTYSQVKDVTVNPRIQDNAPIIMVSKIDDDHALMIHQPLYASRDYQAQVVSDKKVGALGTCAVPYSMFTTPDGLSGSEQCAPYVVHDVATNNLVVLFTSSTNLAALHGYVIALRFSWDGHVLECLGQDGCIATNEDGAFGPYTNTIFSLQSFGPEGSNRFAIVDYPNHELHLGVAAWQNVGTGPGSLYVDSVVEIETQSHLTPVAGFPAVIDGSYSFGLGMASRSDAVSGNALVVAGNMQYSYVDDTSYSGVAAHGWPTVLAVRYNGHGSWVVTDSVIDPGPGGAAQFQSVHGTNATLDGNAILMWQDTHHYTGYNHDGEFDVNYIETDITYADGSDPGPPYGTTFKRTGDSGSSVWYHERDDDSYFTFDIYPISVDVGHYATAENDVGWADINLDCRANVWGTNGGFFFRMSADRQSWWEATYNGLYFVSSNGASRDLVQGWSDLPGLTYFGVTAQGKYLDFYYSRPGHFQEWRITDTRNTTATIHGIISDPNADIGSNYQTPLGVTLHESGTTDDGGSLSIEGPSRVSIGVPFTLRVIGGGLHTGDDGTVPSLSILFPSGATYGVSSGPLDTSGYGYGTFVSYDGSLDIVFGITLPGSFAPGTYQFDFTGFSPDFSTISLIHEVEAVSYLGGGTAFQAAYFDISYAYYRGRRVYQQHWRIDSSEQLTKVHDYRIDPPNGQNGGREPQLIRDANGELITLLMEDDPYGYLTNTEFSYYVNRNGVDSTKVHEGSPNGIFFDGGKTGPDAFITVQYYDNDYDHPFHVIFYGPPSAASGWQVGSVAWGGGGPVEAAPTSGTQSAQVACDISIDTYPGGGFTSADDDVQVSLPSLPAGAVVTAVRVKFHNTELSKAAQWASYCDNVIFAASFTLADSSSGTVTDADGFNAVLATAPATLTGTVFRASPTEGRTGGSPGNHVHYDVFRVERDWMIP